MISQTAFDIFLMKKAMGLEEQCILLVWVFLKV
jgi:hypothetical protein